VKLQQYLLLIFYLPFYFTDCQEKKNERRPLRIDRKSLFFVGEENRGRCISPRLSGNSTGLDSTNSELFVRRYRRLRLSLSEMAEFDRG